MRRPTTVFLSFAWVAAIAAAPAPAPEYHVAAPIAGVGDGVWDYAAVDSTGRYVFVAHGETVTEFDLDKATSRQVGEVGKSHGVVPIPNSRLILVTSGTDATVRIFDVDTGKETARIATAAKPDAAILDPVTGHVLVVNGEAGTISEIDPQQARVTRTIKLEGGLEFAQIGTDRTLYVNNEEKGAIHTIDLKTGRVGATIAMPGCEGPTGLGYDPQGNRLISACANGKAAIVDGRTRRLVKLVAIGRGPDAVIMDPAHRRAFVPCGPDGTLVILSLSGPAGVARIATLPTEAGARTGTIDLKTGTLYLPTAKLGAAPANGRRPAALPGTFHLVVVKRT